MTSKSLISSIVLSVSALSTAHAFAQESAPAASAPAPAASAPAASAPVAGSVEVAGEPTQVPGNMGAAPTAPAWINFALIGGIILFMWLFVFRPQSKRAKEQREFLAALAPGHEVITAGGVVGTIVEVKDNIVSLNVGNTQIRVLKSSISGKLDAAATTGAPAQK